MESMKLGKQWKVAKVYDPQMGDHQRKALYAGWEKAVKRSLNWAKQ